MNKIYWTFLWGIVGFLVWMAAGVTFHACYTLIDKECTIHCGGLNREDVPVPLRTNQEASRSDLRDVRQGESWKNHDRVDDRHVH
jgi:hypothetical protein